MDYNLNKEQMDAVTSTEGYVRVVAGAGSGKTRALVHRFAFLVNEMGVPPANILCVTFTNKAANEMRQRIHSLIGDNDTGYINTFHGFCVSVLQEDSYAMQYPKSFLVLDNSDIDDMFRIIYEERGLTLRDKTFSDARDMIEMQKLFLKPDYYLDMLEMSLDGLKENYLSAVRTDDIIFYGYLYQQKKCFGLDYNDLIKCTLHVFHTHPDIRLKWQERLQYIMIDEFQDIDGLQHELMSVLSAHHRNLFIVGDPDQTIYTWRGANVKYLLEFERNFSPAHTVLMNTNYRSTPEILAAANSLISKNRIRIKKDLIPVLEGGEPVRLDFAKNPDQEASNIAAEILELREAGTPLKDIAILYRAHYVTRSIEDALLREKIPYHIYSGVPFFGRAEVKDALSYLRMVLIRDDLSFRRIVNLPKRNMGRRRMAFLEETAEKEGLTLYDTLKKYLDHEIFRGTKAGRFVQLIEGFQILQEGMPASELLTAILDASGYEEMLRTEGGQARLDNLAELKQAVYLYETGCGEEAGPMDFLSHVAMLTNMDTQEEEGEGKVKLMTVHAAKGLEFPVVFLCGMNEGIFPSRKTKDQAGMEEERRLAFVAMTRAEKRLYLSGAEGRNFDGSPRYPSRFVLDIDQDLLEIRNEIPEGLVRAAREHVELAQKYLPENLRDGLFSEGDRIRHPYLGEGQVLEVDRDAAVYKIQFDRFPTPRSIAARVKMERI